MARAIDADSLKMNCKITGEFMNNFECVSLATLGEIIDKQPTIDPVKQEWISVKDRLPTEEDGKNSNGAIIAIERHEGYTKRWDWGIVADYADEFVCWMPFPEPPKNVQERMC